MTYEERERETSSAGYVRSSEGVGERLRARENRERARRWPRHRCRTCRSLLSDSSKTETGTRSAEEDRERSRGVDEGDGGGEETSERLGEIALWVQEWR